jgi:hypothetical protein
MIKLFYDDYCLRLENCIRYLIQKNITFQCIKMKSELRDENKIYNGPIIFFDKDLIGTFDDLKHVIEKKPPARWSSGV